jgi:predicted nucleic acid-binding protein
VTVVLDSWAVLCLLGNEGPGAERVERALADRPVMSWVNLGEVLYILTRRRGLDDAETAVRDIQRTVRTELPTESLIRQAAAIKAKHPMAYADAYAAATAVAHSAELWTGDPELLIPDAPWRPVDLRA